jgi:hypothetical protein
MSIAGQSTVSATIPSYAGGSVTAIFVPQGGRKPSILKNHATIDSTGHFSLLAWDNSNALYAPSTTTFLITVGAITKSTATVSTVGTSQDITSAFASATQPPSAIGAVQVSNTPSASGKILTSTGTTTAAWQ